MAPQSDPIQGLMLAVALLIIILPFAFAIYILRSLDLAARYRSAAHKFMIVDLFSLIFLVQLPLAMMRSFEEPIAIIVTVLFIVAMLAVWWTTISTVSKAGIHTTLWRALISIIVIPSTYVGTFAIIVFSFTILESSNSRNLMWPVGWIVFCISMLIVSALITRLALRAVANNDTEDPDRNSETPHTS